MRMNDDNNQTPQQILYEIYGFFYSKHVDWEYNYFKDEIIAIENAMDTMVSDLGIMTIPNGEKWQAIVVDTSPKYIAFQKQGNETWCRYYDLDLTVRRVIEMSVDQWFSRSHH